MWLGARRHLKNWRELRGAAERARSGVKISEPPLLLFRNGLRINMVPASHADWDFLFREIFLDRCYQPTNEFMPQPGWSVVDLGANMGFFTCQAASAVQGGRVVSVEPLPLYRKTLEKNVAENRFTNVTVVPGAICGDAGVTIPLTVWYNTQGELKTGAIPKDAARVETVPAKGFTLAEVFAIGQIERCDVLKVDIEGAEYDLFEKIPDALWRRIARVVMEVHTDATHSARQIVDILERQGFKVHLLNPGQGSNTPMLWAVRP
jgi:FkbM family methyltransferase